MSALFRLSDRARWIAVLLLVSAAVAVPGPPPAADAQEEDEPRYFYSGRTGRRESWPGVGSVLILEGNARVWGADLEITGDVGRYIESREEFWVIGSVVAETESLTLETDSLRVLQPTEVGYAYGNVRLRTPDGALGLSRRALYRKRQDWLSLFGDAQVIDRDYVVRADSILFDRQTGIMEAFGEVSIIDEQSETVVTGHHGRFDRRLGIATVDSVPELRMRRGDGASTTVTSRKMAFSRLEDMSLATGDVRFRQGPTLAHADTARFEGEDLLILTGAPSVEQQGRVMDGEEIRFHYVESKLRRIEVIGNASLVDSSPDTLSREFSSIPLANTLNGDSLEIDIVEGAISRTTVRGNARSVYLPEDQKTTVSVNDVRGQSIEIGFLGNRVDVVTVLGAVQGEYRFVERRLMRAEDEESASEAEPEPATSAAQTDAEEVMDVPEEEATPLPSPEPLGAGIESDTAVPVDTTAVSSSALFDFAGGANRVSYVGERAVFAVPQGRIQIEEAAQVEHGTLRLNAERIYFDTVERELLADGDPVLVDKESELIGERMGYLFDPQTGAVADGATRFDDGFYYGKHIRRMDKKTLLASNATYTTCDLAEPHYHFHARKMKLVIGEQAVARQVTFHISDIPLLPLPFYYKSLKGGRQSGIMFPNINIGVSSREGRYIRDLGYYWATNEYTDFKFELDYNERREATFQIENVYNFRYGMSGRARLEYLRRFSETEEGDEWKLTANHNHPDFLEVWRANARLELSSKNITRNNLSNNFRNDLIDSRLYSTASLSRGFDNGSQLSLSASREQFVNTTDDDLTTDNPLSNLNSSLRLGFKTRPFKESRRAIGILRDSQFGHSYSANYDRARSENTERDVYRLQGNLNLSYTPRGRIGPFNFTSSAGFSETYEYQNVNQRFYTTETVVNPDSTITEVVVLDSDRGVVRAEGDSRPSLSISNRLRTDLYGIFDLRIGALRGFKHKLSWGMGHSYRPKLGSKQPESQSVDFTLGNEFSLKYATGAPGPADRGRGAEPGSNEEPPAPGEEQIRKLDQLITWDLSASYNPSAPARQNWSTISSRVNLRPGITQAISFNMSQTIDPYVFELLSTRFSSTLSLRGNLDLGGGLKARQEPKNPVVDRLPRADPDSLLAEREAYDRFGDDRDLYGDPFRDRWLENAGENQLPWTVNLTGSLNQTRNPVTDQLDSRATLSGAFTLGLPGDWKLAWTAGFDVEAGEFTNQQYSLRRRIHCWTLEFTRGLTDGEDFGFSLYLSGIPDLRVDRGERARGGSFSQRLGNY